eukprot:TRINITY_DN60959_c0_g1_i1.p1 TRINITY_DN60959_c0_g1~~TRINITY_DN60959_c0_g1_i1.p1  ORF type:complete len:669 (-),score=106.25 TRINITY_DN60959_c0_g1_i1:129-2135(-)
MRRFTSRPSPTVGGAVLLSGASLLLAWRILARKRRGSCVNGDSRPTRVVVLGLGYCGGAVARRLAREGRYEVVGTTRGQEDPENGRAGIRTIILGHGDGAADQDLAKTLVRAQVVIATAPPDEKGDPFLGNERLRAALTTAAASGVSVIYLSSVGVYGDSGGALVTEETLPAPRTARAKRRLAAEQSWSELPLRRLAIVRLPGIYGPGRGPLAKAREGNALIVKEGHVFSRIHVDDVVRLSDVLVQEHATTASSTGGWGDGSSHVSVINCCDSEPAPQHVVSGFAYSLLGRSPPKIVPFESAELSAMQRSFYEESRRMDNAKLLRIVGVLSYPSYQSGLIACLKEERQPTISRFFCVNLATAKARLARAFSRGQGQGVVRVALIDNGSLKAEATLSLRRLAAEVEAQASARGRCVRVEAVSARFSNRIPAAELEGRAAETLPGWLARVTAEGAAAGGKVLLLPLLIGPSSTLTTTIPSAVRALPELASDVVEIAPSLVCLCPALYSPEATGAAEIAAMLHDRLVTVAGRMKLGDANDHVLLCDHGSPVSRVTVAREAVKSNLEKRLGRSVKSCCMERREGVDFDFNGSLLEESLLSAPANARVWVALLFLQKGKHAGPGGDIDGIVAGVAEKRPDLAVKTTEVLAGHPSLIELLLQRLEKTVPIRLLP